MLKSTTEIITLFISISIFLSCSTHHHKPIKSKSEQQAEMLNHALVEMERNRTLWKENSLHNYRFILDVAPYDPLPPASPAVLEVKEGENVSVELEEWALGSYKDPYKNYDTMGKLYSIIERAVMQKAKYIDVEYDERLGYPRRISIDYGPIDTRILLKVLRFEIL